MDLEVSLAEKCWSTWQTFHGAVVLALWVAKSDVQQANAFR
jgi:hypothetical protein